jgi:phosphoacetylglucosamine mutase
MTPFPRPQNHVYAYGTAGFRMNANLLPCAVFRSGIIAGARSRFLGGKVIGVMVTASHNPVEDNGVKIVDPMGEMLAAEWEVFAASVANLADEGMLDGAKKILPSGSLDTSSSSGKARVFVARDTRPSGPGLVAALKAGLALAGAEVTDFGELTTPQLHWMVRAANTQGDPVGCGGRHMVPSEAAYFHRLTDAFFALTAGSVGPGFDRKVTVDGANGIGGPKLHALGRALGHSNWQVTVVNDGTGGGVLNHDCGADHVKVSQAGPAGLALAPGARYASVDGDADRLVYYFSHPEGRTFRLLDGDKIAALYALFLAKEMKALGGSMAGATMAVVQTAYANGASTAYLREKLGLEVPFACTGVKHLHHKAVEYDVGVYFEANGHGTVVFSDRFYGLLDAAAPETEAQHLALRRLRALSLLINQATGDALADLLAVEGVLACLGWGCVEWDALYTDLPNRLAKCVVKDRNLVTTADADTRVVTPAALQPRINQVVAAHGKSARSFVRPSGTEDVVRIYAEAETRKLADDLAQAVTEIVKELL